MDDNGSLSLCPACGPAPARTSDTRLGKLGKRRRKNCLTCGLIYRTVEIIEAEGRVPGLPLIRAAQDALARLGDVVAEERRTLAALCPTEPPALKSPEASPDG